MAVNKAIVIGFLGCDPKISTTESGIRVAKFSVATTEKAYTASNGRNIPDRTEWHNIVLWGKLVEVAERYLKKGMKVYVEGKMRTRSWEDQNRVKRYITEIHVDDLQMLSGKEDASGSPAQQGTDTTPNYNTDDLPF